MKLSVKIILPFTVITIILVSVLYFITQGRESVLKVISPLGRSFSILAYSSKREPPKKVIYGYLPYWSIKDIKYLQLDKLTDIAYFGLYIDEKGEFVKKNEDGEINPGYNQWQNSEELHKLITDSQKNGVNFALTIISHNDETSEKFLNCRECWDTLYANIKKELVEKKIQDINLNFEDAKLTPKEKARKYTEFTQFLNTKLDEDFGDSHVVVAAFADSIVKDRITDIEKLEKAADQIFIMAYDFHRPSSDNAGPVAPIGGKGVYAEYDIETMLKDYLALVPPKKIILGVPYYGYNWVVEEDIKYAKRIPGEDDIGYSQSQAYKDIMETILELKPDIKWDELGKAPYFTYISPETGSIREVYFDNVQSLAEKYKLVKEKNLAGMGIWALGYDGGYKELWELLEKEFIE